MSKYQTSSAGVLSLALQHFFESSENEFSELAREWARMSYADQIRVVALLAFIAGMACGILFV